MRPEWALLHEPQPHSSLPYAHGAVDGLAKDLAEPLVGQGAGIQRDPMDRLQRVMQRIGGLISRRAKPSVRQVRIASVPGRGRARREKSFTAKTFSPNPLSMAAQITATASASSSPASFSANNAAKSTGVPISSLTASIGAPIDAHHALNLVFASFALFDPLPQVRVPEQQGVERTHEARSVLQGPSERVRMLEGAMFRVGSGNVDGAHQRSRRHVSCRRDVVSGEHHHGEAPEQ